MHRRSQSVKMDAMDRHILQTIQADADLSADLIGQKVHLSPSAVQRRITRLKKAGVIERMTAVINPKAVDRGFTVLVEIALETERPEAVEPFRRWVRQEEVIQSCWYVTGDYDYVLVVLVRDLEEYTQFTERMMNARLSVRRYTSLVSLMTIKRTMDVDLVSHSDDE